MGRCLMGCRSFECRTILVSRLRSSFAFGRRCIPAGCVTRRSHIPDILPPRALPSGRLAALGATTNFRDARLINRIKQRGRPERTTVDLRVAEARDGFQMIGGGVALVPVETIAGIAAV